MCVVCVCVCVHALVWVCMFAHAYESVGVGMCMCLFVCGYVGVCMGVLVKIEIHISTLYVHSPADKIQPSLRPSWLRMG